MHGLSDGPKEASRFCGGQWMFTHEVCKAGAGNQVHSETWVVLVLANFVDRHDRGVAQGGGGSGLGAEAFDETGVGPATKKQHFQGDNAVQGAVTSLEDDAHPALAKFLEQVIAAYGLPG